jgi:rare lipoprotein A
VAESGRNDPKNTIQRRIEPIFQAMTDPILRQARIIAGTAAAAAILFTSSASATRAADEFDAHFADFETPAEPVIPAEAVNLDNLVTVTEAAEQDAIAERLLGSGLASYYGNEFAGRRTASGEKFNPRALTAAHRTLPFGSKVRVTNPANGRSVVVRINDRGPFTRGRTIDLSRGAAEQIGLVARGHGTVQLALVES